MSRLARGRGVKWRRTAIRRSRSGAGGMRRRRSSGGLAVGVILFLEFENLVLDQIVDGVDADADDPVVERAFPRGLDRGEGVGRRFRRTIADEVEVLIAVLGRGDIDMRVEPDGGPAGRRGP